MTAINSSCHSCFAPANGIGICFSATMCCVKESPDTAFHGRRVADSLGAAADAGRYASSCENGKTIRIDDIHRQECSQPSRRSLKPGCEA